MKNIVVCMLVTAAHLAGQAVGHDAALSSWNRWASIDAANLSMRFVSRIDSADHSTASQMQHQEIFAGKLHFDKSGRFAVASAVASGANFTAGWSNSPIGSGPASTGLFLKRLFLIAKPTRWLEVQYGGLGVENGVATDILGYHSQGFLTGQRLLVHNLHRRLLFETFGTTWAYMGDFARPGVEHRLQYLGRVNFRQYWAATSLGQRASVSFDFTNHAGRKTVREAVVLRIPRSLLADSLRLEVYQRVNHEAALGLNTSISKSISKRVAITIGYASVDKHFGDFNSDAFFNGRRLYVGPSLTLARGLSMSVFANRIVGQHDPVVNKRHFEIGVGYNLLARFPQLNLEGPKRK